MVGGRKPLSAYEVPIIHYIADKFRELGLVPGNGDSYFQEVPLLSMQTQIRKNTIVVNEKKAAVSRFIR
ncbi:MAG: hypothetical protein LBT83_04990 [Tannerella sp.]|jgi:hypothetical protein|nr:hypothetical protein [Tannerella sp.]